MKSLPTYFVKFWPIVFYNWWKINFRVWKKWNIEIYFGNYFVIFNILISLLFIEPGRLEFHLFWPVQKVGLIAPIVSKFCTFAWYCQIGALSYLKYDILAKFWGENQCQIRIQRPKFAAVAKYFSKNLHFGILFSGLKYFLIDTVEWILLYAFPVSYKEVGLFSFLFNPQFSFSDSFSRSSVQKNLFSINDWIFSF